MDHVGTFPQLPHDGLAVLHLLFILHIVVERRPEVHRNRADLDFTANRPHLVAEIHRDFDDQVIAPVSVVLRHFDVVLDRDDPNVLLPRQHPRDFIDVVDVRAQHANPRDVRQVLRHVVHRHLKPHLLELSRDGGRLFQPAFDKLDRVSPIPHRHVLGEHLQLGAHLQNRAMIAHHRFLIERLLGKNVLAVGWNDIRINGRRAP